VATVRDDLTVLPLGDTALLEVSYSSTDSASAVLGSRTAAQAVVEGIATSDTVPRGSLRLVGLAEEESVVANGGITRATVPSGSCWASARRRPGSGGGAGQPAH
jgi:hypothetical protein